jgi:hypothetical protein
MIRTIQPLHRPDVGLERVAKAGRSRISRDLLSIDFFVAPTANFRVLFVFIVLAHDRRRIIHFNVPEHPTAQWTAQQIDVQLS